MFFFVFGRLGGRGRGWSIHPLSDLGEVLLLPQPEKVILALGSGIFAPEENGVFLFFLGVSEGGGGVVDSSPVGPCGGVMRGWMVNPSPEGGRRKGIRVLLMGLFHTAW